MFFFHRTLSRQFWVYFRRTLWLPVVLGWDPYLDFYDPQRGCTDSSKEGYHHSVPQLSWIWKKKDGLGKGCQGGWEACTETRKTTQRDEECDRGDEDHKSNQWSCKDKGWKQVFVTSCARCKSKTCPARKDSHQTWICTWIHTGWCHWD